MQYNLSFQYTIALFSHALFVPRHSRLQTFPSNSIMQKDDFNSHRLTGVRSPNAV